MKRCARITPKPQNPVKSLKVISNLQVCHAHWAALLREKPLVDAGGVIVVVAVEDLDEILLGDVIEADGAALPTAGLGDRNLALLLTQTGLFDHSFNLGRVLDARRLNHGRRKLFVGLERIHVLAFLLFLVLKSEEEALPLLNPEEGAELVLVRLLDGWLEVFGDVLLLAQGQRLLHLRQIRVRSLPPLLNL